MRRTLLVGCLAAVALATGVASRGSAEDEERQAAQTTRHASAPFISCQGLGFRPAALRRPRGYERRDTPSARALRRFQRKHGTEYGPRHGWFRIVRRGDTIEFGAGRGPVYSHMGFELVGGRWEWANSGSCTPRWLRDGLEASTWRLDRAYPAPAPGDRELHVLVQEDNCASGRDARGRVRRPLAHYGRRAVTITYFIRPLRGVQTCEGVPPTPATVVLDRDLGERGLRDGGPYPPRSRRQAGAS